MQLEITKTFVEVDVTASVEHITAFAHNLGGQLVKTKEKGDRTILTFSFNDYSQASRFQLSLGSVRGFVSSAIAKS